MLRFAEPEFPHLGMMPIHSPSCSKTVETQHNLVEKKQMLKSEDLDLSLDPNFCDLGQGSWIIF